LSQLDKARSKIKNHTMESPWGERRDPKKGIALFDEQKDGRQKAKHLPNTPWRIETQKTHELGFKALF
jgi:hypothetical protein